MSKIKDFLNKIRPYSKAQVDNMVALERETAMAEEKQWHSSGRQPQITVGNEPQDYFYLYEQSEPAKGKDTNEKRSLEHFIGGYDFNSSSYPAFHSAQTVDQLFTMQEGVVVLLIAQVLLD